MKSLYNDPDKFYAYTEDARTCADETYRALQPIFAKWIAEGYSPREIAALMHQEVVARECETVVMLRVNSRKEKGV